MALPKLINLRGDLFATTFTFGLQAALRLLSSVVLTRVLRPEAYGIITIVLSVLYVIGNVLDTNVSLFIVRDQNAEQSRYLDTAWTMRLGRSVLSSAVLFIGAPLIATRIYNLPDLLVPLRVFCLWFLIDGFESMSFALAIRRKQARLQMYSELAASVAGTLFAIVYCYRYHTFWGIAFGMLLNRLIMTILSYRLYPADKPRLRIDLAAAREILVYSKFTIPSSLLSLGLNQFDKIVFLRLFDLRMLGIYGLAGNITGSIESLISKVSQAVLYPRCAHNFRENPGTFTRLYYAENTKLFAGVLALPASVAGAAHLIIALLYDPRYSQAGDVLQALAIRAMFLSFGSPAEEFLISAGQFHVILTGNVLRASWIILASLAGYHFLGFTGFVYGLAFSGFPPLMYYLWLQKRSGMLIIRFELYKAVFALAVCVASYVVCALILATFPGFRIRL